MSLLEPFQGKLGLNPKGQINVVTTRSGKQFEGPSEKSKEAKESEPTLIEKVVVE